jgi:hypothetical protein
MRYPAENNDIVRGMALRVEQPDAAGGVLDMVAIAGQATSTCARVAPAARPLRWSGCGSMSPTRNFTRVGYPRSTFNHGWAKGGAKLNRLEGCWGDDDTIFFVSTSGGDVNNGDVNSDGYVESFG